MRVGLKQCRLYFCAVGQRHSSEFRLLDPSPIVKQPDYYLGLLHTTLCLTTPQNNHPCRSWVCRAWWRLPAAVSSISSMTTDRTRRCWSKSCDQRIHIRGDFHRPTPSMKGQFLADFTLVVSVNMTDHIYLAQMLNGDARGRSGAIVTGKILS